MKRRYQIKEYGVLGKSWHVYQWLVQERRWGKWETVSSGGYFDTPAMAKGAAMAAVHAMDNPEPESEQEPRDIWPKVIDQAYL